MEFKNIAGPLSEIAKNYNYKEPPGILVSLQELISNLLRALVELLSMLKLPSAGTTDSRAAATLVQYAVIAVGIICAVCLILIVAGRLRHNAAARKLAQSGLINAERPLDRQGWKEQAEKEAMEGNYKESVRALYMSALYLLDERGVTRFQASKTNYEYFYSLVNAGAGKNYQILREPFRNLVDRVEEIWFGFNEALPEDYEFCSAALTKMEEVLAAVPIEIRGDKSKP
ncbi:MAG: DUF4129 domain-containing protein [Candidatus Melainabacteria bacterium]|nr:DUF4129 domain-containing protein [Candidatus Melainabacteria bacterium]